MAHGNARAASHKESTASLLLLELTPSLQKNPFRQHHIPVQADVKEVFFMHEIKIIQIIMYLLT